MLQFFTGKTDTAPGIQADSGKTDKTKQAGVPGTKQGAEKTDTTNLSSRMLNILRKIRSWHRYLLER